MAASAYIEIINILYMHLAGLLTCARASPGGSPFVLVLRLDWNIVPPGLEHLKAREERDAC